MPYKIMTLNIKNSNLKKWDFSKRIIPLCHFIVKENLDIVCLQECSKEMLLKLKVKLYDYFCLSGENSNPILVRKDKFTILKKKEFYLSNNPLIKSKLFLSVQNRTCFCVFLRANNQNIVIYNTHLDFLLNCIKKRQLLVISKLIKEEDYSNIIVAGDFNTTNSKIVRDFCQGNKLTNFTKNIGSTFMYGVNKNVDYILGSLNIKNLKTFKKDNRYLGILLSDHYPVISYFTFK